jgi:hypothetical protein
VTLDRGALQRLLSSATQAQWEWDRDGERIVAAGATSPPDTILGAAPCGDQNSYIYGSEADKALAVAARNALPELLQLIEILEALLSRAI